MMNNEGNFSKAKRWMAGGIGAGVLYASIINSKNGFEFQTTSDLVWMGWLLALAVTSAQFMMTSDFRKINWSILALGIISYIYSIYTNIEGFHALRPHADEYDILNVAGSIVMDVYPELAIAWALGESKIGDLFGNLLKGVKNPEQLTQSQDARQKSRSTDNQSKPQRKSLHEYMSREKDENPTKHDVKWVQPPYPKRGNKR